MDQPTAEIAQMNQARLLQLRGAGVQVPVDLLYLTSMLEFLLLEDLDQAQAYHQRRLAPILDNLIVQLGQAQENQKSAQARATLLAP